MDIKEEIAAEEEEAAVEEVAEEAAETVIGRALAQGKLSFSLFGLI